MYVNGCAAAGLRRSGRQEADKGHQPFGIRMAGHEPPHRFANVDGEMFRQGRQEVLH